MGVVIDPVNGWAYFGGDNNITILNGTNLVATIETGAQAGPGTYDPATGWVYFALSGDEHVVVINGTSIFRTMGIGAFPAGMAYDPANAQVYVAVLDGAVTIISPTGGSSSVSIRSPGSPTPAQPLALAYDPGNALMYVLVGNVPNPTVALLNGTGIVANISLPANSDPWALAYDPTNGFVYVADPTTSSVSVLNGTSYLATVALDQVPYSFVVNNGTGAVYAFVYGPSNFTGLDIINGTAFDATLTLGFTPRAAAYDGQTGFLCFVGSINASKIPGVAALVNGTTILANFSIGDGGAAVAVDPFTGLIYVPLNAETPYQAGIVDLLGPGTFYSVTVTAVGLTAGALWFVNETGFGHISSGKRTISLGERNGTFTYSAGVVNGSRGPAGTYTVNGAAVAVSVPFGRVHEVTFREKGLPSGTEWFVNVTGVGATTLSTSSLATKMQFSEPAGSYSYTVASVDKNYAPKVGSGALVVHSGSVSKSVTFKPVTYLVTVTETGLPAKAKWCIDIVGGKHHCTARSSQVFAEPNGTYSYTLTTGKAGYSGPSGSFTVVAATSLSVGFVA